MVYTRVKDVLAEMEKLAEEAGLSERQVQNLVRNHKKVYAAYVARRCEVTAST